MTDAGRTGPRRQRWRGHRCRVAASATRRMLAVLIALVLIGFGWADPGYLSLGNLLDIGYRRRSSLSRRSR